MTDSSTPAWEVTQQVEATDMGPSGTFVSGVRITFRTSAGVVGSVFVPHGDYTVENARRLIAERAAIVAGVSGLRG